MSTREVHIKLGNFSLGEGLQFILGDIRGALARSLGMACNRTHFEDMVASFSILLSSHSSLPVPASHQGTPNRSGRMVMNHMFRSETDTSF